MCILLIDASNSPVKSPSHRVINSVLILRTWSCSNPVRFLKKQSISSMKMMDGASLCAKLLENTPAKIYKNQVPGKIPKKESKGWTYVHSVEKTPTIDANRRSGPSGIQIFGRLHIRPLRVDKKNSRSNWSRR